MINLNTIGKRVEYLRNLNDLSQGELAKKIGETQSTISRIEKDEFKKVHSSIYKIAQLFNVNSDWIISGNGSIENANQNHLTQETDPYKDKLKDLKGLEHNDGTKVNSKDKRKILQLLDGTLGDLMYNQSDVYEEFNDEDIEMIRQSLISTYLDVRDMKRKERLKKAKEQKEQLEAEIKQLEKDINDKDDNSK